MLQPFRLIRTYLPVQGGNLPEALKSEDGLRAISPAFGPVLELLRRSDPVGRVGDYAAVWGAHPAPGGYIPLPGAHPAQGQVGAPDGGLAIAFVTYASDEVAEEAGEAFIEALAEIHPFEHPVIEVVPIELWMPDPVRG